MSERLTNTQVLNAAPEALSEWDRDRRTCLRVALRPRVCPGCLAEFDQVQAARVDLDRFDAEGYLADDAEGSRGKPAHEFACVNPGCGVRLEPLVPDRALGAAPRNYVPDEYFWGIDRAWLKDTVARARRADLVAELLAALEAVLSSGHLPPRGRTIRVVRAAIGKAKGGDS